MSVIGKTVKSKVTGATDVLTGISGSKPLVTFESGFSIAVSVEALEIEEFPNGLQLLGKEIKL